MTKNLIPRLVMNLSGKEAQKTANYYRARDGYCKGFSIPYKPRKGFSNRQIAIISTPCTSIPA